MAISYTKTNWIDNESPAINAENLNKIENGIESCVNGINSALPLSGGTITGDLNLGNNILKLGGHNINNVSTDNYLDISGTVRFLGATVFNTNLDVTNKRITNLATPTTSTDATNKQYVDDTINQRINSLDATEVSY